MAKSGEQPKLVDVHVGVRIRLRRRTLGLSQQQVADELKLTFQQMQKYERGDNRVSASKLYDLSRVLRTSTAYFFEGLADFGSGDEGQKSERARLAFLTTSEGPELASLFCRLKPGRTPRRVLDLLRAMGDDAEEESGLKPVSPAPSSRS